MEGVGKREFLMENWRQLWNIERYRQGYYNSL